MSEKDSDVDFIESFLRNVDERKKSKTSIKSGIHLKSSGVRTPNPGSGLGGHLFLPIYASNSPYIPVNSQQAVHR